MQPIPLFLPGKSHGQWSLVGYNFGAYKESDVMENTPVLLPQKFQGQRRLGGPQSMGSQYSIDT